MISAYTLSFEGGSGPTVRAVVTLDDPSMRRPSTTIRGSWAATSEALQSLLRFVVITMETELAERDRLRGECNDLKMEVGALVRQLEDARAQSPDGPTGAVVADLKRRNLDQPTPCPVCLYVGGFHNSVVHGAHQVPSHLIWKPGGLAPWAAAIEDATLSLKAVVTPEIEEKLRALNVRPKRPLGPVGQIMLAAVVEDAGAVLKRLSD